MDYYVSILGEEESELADVLSMTGTVNNAPVAAKVRLSAIARLSKKDVKLAKQKALIQAFTERAETPSKGADKVSL